MISILVIVIIVCSCIAMISMQIYTFKEDSIALVVATSSATEISRKRQENLRKQAKEHRLQLTEVSYFTEDDARQVGISVALHNNFMKILEIASKTNAKFVIVAEDDVQFCSNFRYELKQTIDDLPKEWRTLHLCPGYYWGRSKGEPAHTYRLNPEEYVHPHDEAMRMSERVFRCPVHGNAWGGPIAILLTPSRAADLHSILKLSNGTIYDDEFMRIVGDDFDFVARDPQLCYENQQGGSVFEKTMALI